MSFLGLVVFTFFRQSGIAFAILVMIAAGANSQEI